MPASVQYKTRQKDELIRYLSTVQGKHITAGDVVKHFREQGEQIGQSTIYRQLERLVDEGIVSKYTIDANSPACFEYIGAESHQGAEHCYHCKCEGCGKLIHLHCEEMEEFREHLKKEHGFRMDPFRTVFYGLCEDCQRKGNEAQNK